MHRKMLGPILAVAVGLSLGLAGCTGQFDVEQTEPFRVQIEDGETRNVDVSEEDDEPERVFVTNERRVETIDVEVRVTPASERSTTILVQVIDEDTDEVFVEREIVVRDDDAAGDDNETMDNETGDGFFEDDGDGATTEFIQNIDVRGSKNIVIVTTAQTGDADIDITATEASGQGEADVDSGDDTGGDPGNETGNETDDGFLNEDDLIAP